MSLCSEIKLYIFYLPLCEAPDIWSGAFIFLQHLFEATPSAQNAEIFFFEKLIKKLIKRLTSSEICDIL
jgi:hypothetical protein